MASDRQQPDAETRIRAAIVQLLGGDIPDGLKCDVKSLCVLAGVPRATLYRTYPHLKAEFDRQRDAAQENGMQPDPRLARIDRCKTEIIDLRSRLADQDRKISKSASSSVSGTPRCPGSPPNTTRSPLSERSRGPPNARRSVRCRADSRRPTHTLRLSSRSRRSAGRCCRSTA
jgi:hypothetical protein